MRTRTLDIAIVGYGTAGQAAAILLGGDGHRVQVFERAPQLGPVGAGFLLQPVGLRVLWEMGLLPAALRHGRRIDRLFGDTHAGRAVMDMRYAGLDPRLFGLGMQRGALFALLAEAWPARDTVERGCRIVGVSDDGRRIRGEDGREHGPYDLVVAADGSASCLRAALGTPRLDRVYPWGALWCLLPQQHWDYPHELRQRYVAARKMVGMLPVGTRPGDATPRISFFWSLPTAAMGAWAHAGVVPWRNEVAQLWPQLRAHVDGIVDGAQLARATYRDALLDRWHRGRVVLLGDAAHAMSPQLGQGVNMALLDALALRDALRAQPRVEDALAHHVRERRGHAHTYQFWSRWLTPLFQSERDLAARLRDLAFLPLGRLPGSRGRMLRVLSGLQHGAFGALRLPPAFLDALGSAGAASQENADAALPG